VNHRGPQISEVTKEVQEEDVEVPPPQTRKTNDLEDSETDEDLSEVSPTTENQQHPEWTPETRYLRRKVFTENNRSLGNANDSPYALRSKSSRTQFPEDRNESHNNALQTPENSRNQCTDDLEDLHEDVNTPHTHSYNLRSRTQTS
jgi:hypothetical protein